MSDIRTLDEVGQHHLFPALLLRTEKLSLKFPQC